MEKKDLKYHHLGVPVIEPREGEVYLPDFKMYVQGFSSSQFGIESMRFEEGCPLPALVQTMPHVAFQVDDIWEAIKANRGANRGTFFLLDYDYALKTISTLSPVTREICLNDTSSFALIFFKISLRFAFSIP